MAVGNRKRGFGGPATKGTKAALRAARGSDTPRASLYDEVTAKIIAQLEAGLFPWVQPWNSAVAVPGLPRNAVSGRPYSGVNVLILWGAVIEGCYPSQDWLTFRQALAAGGCVRKGERGHTIFYADRFTADDGREGGEGGEGAEGEPRSIPFLKRFVVFNAAQCDGLPERLTADPTPLPPCEQHEGAEALIAATGAISASAGHGPSMTLAAIMCGCHRNWPSPIKSTSTGRRCTNLAIGREARSGWRATSRDGSVRPFTPARNCVPN